MIAGLIADGVTEIHNLKYIDRGYEHFEDKLRKLGAQITRRSYDYNTHKMHKSDIVKPFEALS